MEAEECLYLVAEELESVVLEAPFTFMSSAVSLASEPALQVCMLVWEYGTHLQNGLCRSTFGTRVQSQKHPASALPLLWTKFMETNGRYLKFDDKTRSENIDDMSSKQ